MKGMEPSRRVRCADSPTNEQQQTGTPARQPTQYELVLLQTLRFISISDTAFVLQSFSGTVNCGDKAGKWLNQFKLYISFKKIATEAVQAIDERSGNRLAQVLT
jgi:hypothetical protein